MWSSENDGLESNWTLEPWNPCTFWGEAMTVLQALSWATDYLKKEGIAHPRLNAELLLARSMHLSREELFIRLRDPLAEEKQKTLEDLVRRRSLGEPLQYILGRQEFWSIDLKVDSRVLIPRPETEHLVEEALSVLAEIPSKNFPSVLELGTGSGAVAIALAKEVAHVFLVATDLSWDALAVAKENAKRAGVWRSIQFLQGDLLGPFRSIKAFDLILSNPPYLSDSERRDLSREVKDHEPAIALSGGRDGLDFYRAILPRVPSYLKRDGWLLLEVGIRQADRVSEMIEAVGQFRTPVRVKDLSGIERVVKAQRSE